MPTSKANALTNAIFEGVPNYEPKSPRTRKRKLGNLNKTPASATTKKNRSASRTTPKRARPANLPKGVVWSPALKLSKSDFTASIEFFKEITTLPVFLVNAHACICIDTRKRCYGQSFKSTFAIPENVYFLNFVQPGGFFCLTNSEHIMQEEYEQIRKLMFVHSESDLTYGKNVGKSRRALYSGFKRATGAPRGEDDVLYPNIAFTFNEFGPDGGLVEPEKNIYGVYRLDTLDKDAPIDLNNTMSVLKQDADRPGNNWFLEDIIQETLAATGESHAIFVLAGCLTTCGTGAKEAVSEEAKKKQEHDEEKTNERAARLMEDAHNRYTALKPVLTKEEIEVLFQGADLGVVLPHNIGVPDGPETLNVAEIKRLHKNDPETLREYVGALSPLLHEDERAEIQKILTGLQRRSGRTPKPKGSS